MKRFSALLTLTLLTLMAIPAIAAPDYAVWSASVKPSDLRGGEGGQIVVTVRLQKPWHLYSTTQPAGGPVKTTIELAPGGPLQVVGAIAQPKPLKKHDAGFNMVTEIFENKVSFGIPVRVKPGLKGRQKIAILLHYQLCNDTSCLPPKRMTLTTSFTVAPGVARAKRKRPILTVPKTAKATPVWDERSVPKIEGTLILAGGPGDAAPPPAPAKGQSGDAYRDQIENAKRGGLLPFLGLSFIAGFLALLTPCVFPMIPITVSYFAKQKAEQGANAFIGPVAYSLGIIGTFTGLGILVTLIFGAAGIRGFATSPWINLALSALFVVLALSLFGVFEIGLPSGLANIAGSGSRRGGIIGAVLMGLTFTITSFTCTVPFVGTLLGTAAQGSLLFPVLGMLAFSTAFAAPFFLLAMFPRWLSSLPRSGAWLVTVKAFMGMLELAAALKFLSNADLVWQLGWLTRPVFLAIWAILGVIAGLYLLGFIRFPHDEGISYGPIRRLIGVGSIAAAVFCLAGIAGRNLGELDPFVPPAAYPYRGELHAAASHLSGPAGAAEVTWLSRYDDAIAAAKAKNRPVFIDFTGVTCTNCRLMEQNIFPKPEVNSELAKYVTVRLYTDRETAEDQGNQKLQEKLTGVITLPLYVTVTPEGKVTKVFQGLTRNPAEFVTFLQQGRIGAVAQR